MLSFVVQSWKQALRILMLCTWEFVWEILQPYSSTLCHNNFWLILKIFIQIQTFNILVTLFYVCELQRWQDWHLIICILVQISPYLVGTHLYLSNRGTISFVFINANLMLISQPLSLTQVGSYNLWFAYFWKYFVKVNKSSANSYCRYM